MCAENSQIHSLTLLQPRTIIGLKSGSQLFQKQYSVWRLQCMEMEPHLHIYIYPLTWFLVCTCTSFKNYLLKELHVVTSVVYRKKLFGHLNDQNLFLTDLVFIHSSWLSAPQTLGISWTKTAMGSSFVSQLPNPWNFLSDKKQWEHLLSQYLITCP